MNFLLVFLGGGVGSVIRFVIGLAFQRSTNSLPLATLLANFIACFIFAIVVYSSRHTGSVPLHFKMLILTGFCGGLSTFSTFGYETFLLLREKLFLYAFLNIAISCIACILIFIFLIPKSQ